jgi:predicted RNA-binding protein associated with RNAse of E/G family
MFNENLEIVQWYFDIIKSSGLDERGIPYFDDLYLDVVALPPDDILLLDEDELEEALQCKDITKEDYDLAYEEAEQIISDIDVEKLIKVSNKYLRMVLQDK